MPSMPGTPPLFKAGGTFLAVALSTLPNIACGATALHVTHAPAGSTVKPIALDGLPFFQKKGACRQQVAWFEPTFNLALDALTRDKDGALQAHPRGAVALSLKTYRSADVTSLSKLLNNGPSDEDTVLRAWRVVVALSDPHTLSRDFASLEESDRLLVRRSTVPTTYVDYSDQHYVNAKVPFAGSANVDAKLAEDGSLTEASAQIETKTLETVLGALPISGIISGALGLPSGKSIAGIATGDIEAFRLTISVTGHVHTLSRLVQYQSPCPIPTDLTLANATDYQRDDFAPPSTPDVKTTNPSDSSSTKADAPAGAAPPGKAARKKKA